MIKTSHIITLLLLSASLSLVKSHVETGEIFDTFALPGIDPLASPPADESRTRDYAIQFDREFDHVPHVCLGLLDLFTAGEKPGYLTEVIQVNTKAFVMRMTAPPGSLTAQVKVSWIASDDSHRVTCQSLLLKPGDNLGPLAQNDVTITSPDRTITVTFFAHDDYDGDLHAVSGFNSIQVDRGAAGAVSTEIALKTRVVGIKGKKVFVEITAGKDTVVAAVGVTVVLYRKSENTGKVILPSAQNGILLQPFQTQMVFGGKDIKDSNVAFFAVNALDVQGSDPTDLDDSIYYLRQIIGRQNESVRVSYFSFSPILFVQDMCFFTPEEEGYGKGH